MSCFYCLTQRMCVFVHVWYFQYIWEASVIGVCIVPAQRIPAPGSFITQTPLLSLLCLYWTPPRLSSSLNNPVLPSPTPGTSLGHTICCSHQDPGAPLFFFYNLCLSPNLPLSALSTKNSKGSSLSIHCGTMKPVLQKFPLSFYIWR